MIDRLHYITQGNTKEEQVNNARNACEAGVTWLQFRMKVSDEGLLMEAAKEVSRICKKMDVTFIVNDHVSIAKKIDADGAHLGKEDMSPLEARKILGADKIIGATANTLSDIKELLSKPINYIGLGPFRFTSTKKKLSPVLGQDGFKDILSRSNQVSSEVPIVAIGGITTDDVPLLLEAGVHGVAVASLINHAEDPKEIVNQLKTQLAYEYTKDR